MARSTPVIALAGTGVLVIAVGAAALRGTDDDAPEGAPTDTVASQTDIATPDPTGPPTDLTSATPEPDATPSPAATATGTDDPEPAGGGDADGGGDEGDDGDTPTTTADTDTDPDETVAMGRTGTTDVQETPHTGGGGLALLGGVVAAGAVVAGRRPRG